MIIENPLGPAASVAITIPVTPPGRRRGAVELDEQAGPAAWASMRVPAGTDAR